MITLDVKIGRVEICLEISQYLNHGPEYEPHCLANTPIKRMINQVLK